MKPLTAGLWAIAATLGLLELINLGMWLDAGSESLLDRALYLGLVLFVVSCLILATEFKNPPRTDKGIRLVLGVGASILGLIPIFIPALIFLYHIWEYIFTP